MKIPLIIALVAASLILPSSALASGFYKGPIDPGNQAEVIEFRVEFDKNRPKKVAKLRWANVPTVCTGGGSSAVSGVLDGKVRIQNRHFDSTQAVRNSNATVHITGRFKSQDEKIVGTFQQTGSSGGCASGDTGELDYHAKRGPPESRS